MCTKLNYFFLLLEQFIILKHLYYYTNLLAIVTCKMNGISWNDYYDHEYDYDGDDNAADDEKKETLVG